MTAYPAIFFFEARPSKEDPYMIHVFFPDLERAGLPSATTGDNMEDAREAAEDFLAISLDMAADEGKEQPSHSLLEEINPAAFYKKELFGKPFRIEMEYIEL